MTEISHYMKLLLKSEFPQFNLLTPGQFLKELEKRNIRLWERDLEYFDKIGIIKPCLRLNKPKINPKKPKYTTLMLGNPHNWKQLYKQKCIFY